jgi:hypothetical protein
MLERGQRVYARWGWLAVFVTPAIVSGTAKMPPYRFAFVNPCCSSGAYSRRWRPVPARRGRPVTGGRV